MTVNKWQRYNFELINLKFSDAYLYLSLIIEDLVISKFCNILKHNKYILI